MIKFFRVGGAVRDEILNLPCKDLDFAVEAPSFDAMKRAVVERCGGNPDDAASVESIIKVEKREFVTIRAIDPKLGGVDFVLCRKDGTYSDGRRPDSVEAGTLLDDLARRDFTVNAMARGDDGALIDPFGGKWDLSKRILRCVGDTATRMREDSLRMLRAFRFALTKDFIFSDELRGFLNDYGNAALLDNVSIERVREELIRCFDKDTYATLRMFKEFPYIERAIFSRNLKLTPTIYAVK